MHGCLPVKTPGSSPASLAPMEQETQGEGGDATVVGGKESGMVRGVRVPVCRGFLWRELE